jgi:hypothetical protein
MSDQTRITSLVEVCLNVAIGFAVSMTAWPFVGALYDIPYSYSSHIGITIIFTVLSISRGYIVRRFFANGLHHASVELGKKIYAYTHNGET